MATDGMRKYNIERMRGYFGEPAQMYIVLRLVSESRTQSGIETLFDGSDLGRLGTYIGNLTKSKMVCKNRSSFELTNDSRKILEALREIEMRAGVYELTKSGREDLKYLAKQIGTGTGL